MSANWRTNLEELDRRARMMRPEFDDRDREILERNVAALDKIQGPRVGDFVLFSCGTVRRISYAWDWEGSPHEYQTSDEGSFYLGEGYVSFSGSLWPSIPEASLVPTDEKRPGSVWFFHHGHAEAHNGVYTTAEFRVFRCDRKANRFGD